VKIPFLFLVNEHFFVGQTLFFVVCNPYPCRLNFTVVKKVTESNVIAPGLIITWLGGKWVVTDIWGLRVKVEPATRSLWLQYLLERQNAKNEIRNEAYGLTEKDEFPPF